MNLLNVWRTMMQAVVGRHCAAEVGSIHFQSRRCVGAGIQRHAPSALPPKKSQVPTLREAWWTSGLVWKGVSNIEYIVPPVFEHRTVKSVEIYYTDYEFN